MLGGMIRSFPVLPVFGPDVPMQIAFVDDCADAVATALKQSRRGKRWSAKRREVTAASVLNTYMGLRVLSRAGYPAKALQAIVDNTLSTI